MKDDTLLGRIREEIGHWLRKNWSYASVGAHWDATEDYDEINEQTYSYHRRFVDGYRLSEIPDGSRVLDFCARTGNGTVFFHEKGKIDSVVCADVSFRMGEICTERLQEAGVRNYSWVPIGGAVFPFKSCSFDAVLFFETIEHFPDPEKLLLELARILRSGGEMILTTPNLLWEPVHALAAILKLHHSEGPHRFLSYRRLRNMVARAGLSVRRSETTVLVPGGGRFLTRAGVWLEERTRGTLMPVFGLRRIMILRKPTGG